MVAITSEGRHGQDLASPHSLATLVENLKQYLGTKSGIDSAEIEVDELKSMIGEYLPTPGEWYRYGKADPSRNYTRLLVDKINGKCNLVSRCACATPDGAISDMAAAIHRMEPRQKVACA